MLGSFTEMNLPSRDTQWRRSSLSASMCMAWREGGERGGKGDRKGQLPTQQHPTLSAVNCYRSDIL